MTTKIYSVTDTQTKIQVDGTDVVTINKVGGITKASVDQMPALGTAITPNAVAVADFTGIPTWVKKITVMLNGISTSGTSNPLLQLGSTTIQTTSYLCSGSSMVNASSPVVSNYTTGFGLSLGNSANTIYGQIVFILVSGNTWNCAGTFGLGNTFAVGQVNGGVTLSGTLDRLRLTTVNGTDTFDSGSVNILYE